MKKFEKKENKWETIVYDWAKKLPHQGPIRDFVHHNTLEGLQQYSFWVALENAVSLHGSTPIPNINFYRKKFAQGELDPKYLDKNILNRVLNSDSSVNNGQQKSFFPLHQIWEKQNSIHLRELVNPQLIRFTSAFLDQGLAHWKMPNSDSMNFLECYHYFLKTSVFKIVPFNKNRIKVFELEREEMIQFCLTQISDDYQVQKDFLKECLMDLKGWIGLIYILEKQPDSLQFKRDITVLDFLILKLIFEYTWTLRHCKGKIKKIQPQQISYARIDLKKTFRPIHLAFEKTYYSKIIAQIQKHKPPKRSEKIDIQAIYCIDDRECSLRRYTEQVSPYVETFGFAGHFALDYFLELQKDSPLTKFCPPVVNPQYVIKSQGNIDRRPELLDKLDNLFTHSHFYSVHQIFQDWWKGFKDGIISAGLMIQTIAQQAFLPRKIPAVVHHKELGQFSIFRDDPINESTSSNKDRPVNSFLYGYTYREMADRIGMMLKTIGLTSDFAPVILIVGHGSTASNNHYFAAYQCGACSGRMGEHNARIIAQAGNNIQVRKALEEFHNLQIPASTSFIASMHDTCKDQISFFDSIPLEHLFLFKRFSKDLKKILVLNAKERSLRFERLSDNLDKYKAHFKMSLRSQSIFEPRPELGHAGNALAIVARRETTRDLFLNRRAFLQSYDYEDDPEGEILHQILSAVIPVCGGINLEYFFSRVDNDAYGSGSKLSHNIVGMFGIMNGTEGDLLNGLPTQMIEVHDPIRLLIIVEQNAELIKKVLDKAPGLKTWVENHWVNLCALDPETHESQMIYGEEI